MSEAPDSSMLTMPSAAVPSSLGTSAGASGPATSANRRPQLVQGGRIEPVVVGEQHHRGGVVATRQLGLQLDDRGAVGSFGRESVGVGRSAASPSATSTSPAPTTASSSTSQARASGARGWGGGSARMAFLGRRCRDLTNLCHRLVEGPEALSPRPPDAYPRQMPLIQIAQRAEDLARATAFYADLLGARRRARRTTRRAWSSSTSAAPGCCSSRARPAACSTSASTTSTRPSSACARPGSVVESEPHLIFAHDDDTLGPAGTDEWMAFVTDSEGNTVGLVEQRPRG